MWFISKIENTECAFTKKFIAFVKIYKVQVSGDHSLAVGLVG